MNSCEAEAPRSTVSVEEARTRVGTALALLELAAQILDELPPVEVAFPLGDREIYRCLQAAESAEAWLVGLEPGDSVDHPGVASALGDGQRIFEWSEEETERHFESAIRDWSERQGSAPSIPQDPPGGRVMDDSRSTECPSPRNRPRLVSRAQDPGGPE